MAGKQAKILTDQQIESLLAFASFTRNPERNRAIVLLSIKAGLRAGEIANLTWDMVVGPTGAVGSVLELPDRAAKKQGWPPHSVAPRPARRTRDLARQSVNNRWSCGRVRTRRENDSREYRELVCGGVSHRRPERMLVPFWPPHVHHPSRTGRTSGRRIAARRSAVGRSSVDRDDPAVHRRRYRCPAQAVSLI
jgi:integrase